MQALILAGGKGTRLRPLTVYTPKPIVPICNRPFLLYQIDTLKRAGITDITLSLSYQPNKIEQLLGDGRLRCETEVHGRTATDGNCGRLQVCRRSDSRTNSCFQRRHPYRSRSQSHPRAQRTKATATIVLAPVENPQSYGLVETEKDGRIHRFLEKPKADEITCNTINAGTYVSNQRCSIIYLPARTIRLSMACFLIY